MYILCSNLTAWDELWAWNKQIKLNKLYEIIIITIRRSTALYILLIKVSKVFQQENGCSRKGQLEPGMFLLKNSFYIIEIFQTIHYSHSKIIIRFKFWEWKSSDRTGHRIEWFMLLNASTMLTLRLPFHCNL